MNLEEYRKQIDEIDEKVIALLDERFDTCVEIGECKKANNIATLDSKREETILNKIEDKAKHKEEIKNIYKEIFNESKKVQ